MSTNTTAAPTYGNITKPGRQGFYGLPMGVTLIELFFAFGILIAMTTQQFIAALLLAVAGVGVAALVMVRGKDGRSIYERGVIMAAFRRRERRGDNVYLAGVAGRTPDGRTRLPGLLAPSELTEHHDSYGNPFGLIRLKSAKHYTVVLETYPDGDALVDRERVDSMVAHWGAWLAQLGIDGGVVAASVTVESAPDTGLRLDRMVRGNLSNDASRYAHDVAMSLSTELRAGSPAITTRIALTFSGAGFDNKNTDQGLEAMAAELGSRIPVLISTLYDTGAGTSVRACTAQDIVDFTRTAYDPTVALNIEQARTEGGTGLTWEDAGPTFHDERVDRYFHDRAVSKTWQMFTPPTGQFHSNALGNVLQPVAGVLRKRVTMLYRPIPVQEAVQLVERDQRNAELVNSQKARPSVAQLQRKAFAAAMEREIQEGAGLVRFGMLITTTVASSSEFPRLDKVIPGLTARARLQIRETLGNHAVAFQAALPLGVVPIEHAAFGKIAKEWI